MSDKNLNVKLKIVEGGTGSLTLKVYQDYPGLFFDLKIDRANCKIEIESFEVADKKIVKKLRDVADLLEKYIKEFE